MKKKILKSVWIIMFVIAVGALVYEIIMIHNSYQQYKEVDDTNNEIISTYTKSTSESPTDDFTVDWEKLLSVNKDIIAWIRIPDTNINYLVVQGKSNSQYLRKNIYGNYSYGGCLFVDSSTQKPFENMNTIIYGHNLMNGSMFSGLKKFSNNEYANSHKKIYIYLPNGITRTYKVFAFYTIKANDYRVYDSNVEDLSEYYQIITENNQLSLDDSNDNNNPVLTLSTCTNNKEDERYILQAYLDF